MVEIIAFKGILYNQHKVSDLKDVVSPPYDIITKEAQERYYQRHINNVVRLELGKDLSTDNGRENRYTRAAGYLTEWLATGILERESLPSIYLYEIEYISSQGENKRLKGFFSLMFLEEFDSGKIIPHEETFSSPKLDRLNLIRACRANFSPIFSLYSDPDGEIIGQLESGIKGKKPRINIIDEEGIRHRLWTISDQGIIGDISNKMRTKSLFVADGHHRYETGLIFRNEMREKMQRFNTKEGFDYILMFLSNMDDDGLTILPTHRLVTTPYRLDVKGLIDSLKRYFKVKSYNLKEKERGFMQDIKREGERAPTIGMYCENAQYYLLTLKEDYPIPKNNRSMAWNGLDVSILQTLIIERILKIDNPVKEDHISYIKGENNKNNILYEMKKQGAGLAFFLNPPKIEEIKEIVEAGERMPHKSTYFYPKPLTGLVMNKF